MKNLTSKLFTLGTGIALFAGSIIPAYAKENKNDKIPKKILSKIEKVFGHLKDQNKSWKNYIILKENNNGNTVYSLETFSGCNDSKLRNHSEFKYDSKKEKWKINNSDYKYDTYITYGAVSRLSKVFNNKESDCFYKLKPSTQE